MFNKSQIYLILILIGLCFLVYANSLDNSFLDVDDYASILENPEIAQPAYFWLDPPNLLNSFTYFIAGYKPFIYHLVNVVVHCINTLLVFLFLSLFFNTVSSFLGGMLFAVHPIHTEAVTWVSGKPYALLATFILSTFLLYYRATHPVGGNKKFNPLLYLSSLAIFSYYLIHNYAFFFLLPLLLILSDVIFEKWHKSWKYWIPFIAIVALRLILAQNVILDRIAKVRYDIGMPVEKNPILYFIYSFFSHLKLLIWPARLTFYHEPVVVSLTLRNYSVFYFLLAIIILLITFKKAKKVFFALSIFIVFLTPTYSPIPIASLVAERYLYFPSIALSIFLAFIYQRYGERYARFKSYILTTIICVIAAYGVRTVARNEDWKTPARFWRRTVMVSPYSSRAHNSLGVIYAEEGNIRQAIQEYERAIELNPQNKKAYNNLANLYHNTGDKKQAIALYGHLIRQYPRFAPAYNNLAELYIGMAKFKEALELLKQAIEIDPQYVDAYNNLGLVYKGLNDKQNAITSLRKALSINPKYVKAYNNLATVYNESGDKEESIILWRKALEIDPHYAQVYFNLSVAFFYDGLYDLAIKYCDEAQALGYKVPQQLLDSLQPYRKKR